MIPRTVKTIYEGAGVKGIKRAPKEVLERVVGKLNATNLRNDPTAKHDPFFTTALANRSGQESYRPRVVTRDGEAFLVLHRGVRAGGKKGLLERSSRMVWDDDYDHIPGVSASADIRVARGFAGKSATERKRNRINERFYQFAPNLRRKWTVKKARPNVGSYLLPESEIENSRVLTGYPDGPEWEVRHPQVGDHLVRNKKYYSAKLRLRELAGRSGTLIELARVQSVAGNILNITPVPRKVADPILRSMRRKLEKGGDRGAVRAAFLGPAGPRIRSSKKLPGASMPPSGKKFIDNLDDGTGIRETDLWKPRVVEVDGKKSLLHYRIASDSDSLRETWGSQVGKPGSSPEAAMRNHVSAPGSAISTSVSRAKAMRFTRVAGKKPVEGIYATPLDDLIRNQREKLTAAMVNSRYPSEREITQTHGANLLKVRTHTAMKIPGDEWDSIRYARTDRHGNLAARQKLTAA